MNLLIYAPCKETLKNYQTLLAPDFSCQKVLSFNEALELC